MCGCVGVCVCGFVDVWCVGEGVRVSVYMGVCVYVSVCVCLCVCEIMCVGLRMCSCLCVWVC